MLSRQKMASRQRLTPLAAAVLIAIASCGAPSAASAANLLKNPGFEAPLVPPGSFTNFSVGQTDPVITRWTVTGASGNVALIHRTFAVSGFTITPRSGNQCLDLTGGSTTPTGVKQTVPTTVGAAYVLNFWVGNTYQIGTFMGTSSTVTVFVNGQLLTTVMNDGGATLTNPFWRRYTATFTATTAATTIAFINADPSSDTANLLDDVSLDLQPQ